MNHIIAIPKVSNTAKASDTQSVIHNNGFFPDIALLDIRQTMRIDGTVTDERLKHAALEAIQTVNRDLKTYRLTAQQDNINTLADSDDETLNGESEKVYLYKRAVYCLTAANLYERYRSFDSTKQGNDKAEQLIDTAGDLKRDYHFAVRDILGGNRMIVELV